MELKFGESQFDQMDQMELRRQCQRLYVALVASNSVMRVLRVPEIPNRLDPFWASPDGSGGRALEMARQALQKAQGGANEEIAYRSFFRYAVDLLFEGKLGSNWHVCEKCGLMVGDAAGHPDFGELCDGKMVKLEWRHLHSHV